MNVEKNMHGAWIVSDIVNGYRTVRTYLYYTKKEAITAFKREMKQLKQK